MFHITLLIVSSVIFGNALTVTSMPQKGTKCDDFHCSQPHGYLIYKSSYNSYLRRRTITSMGKPTTFVLHFKNITGVDRKTPIIVHQLSYSRSGIFQIRSCEEQIFIFRDTYQAVIFAGPSMKLHYMVEFYVGCNILQGKNITINQQEETKSTTQSPQVQEPGQGYVAKLLEHYLSQNTMPSDHAGKHTSDKKCWLILPTLKSKLEVHETDAWSYFMHQITGIFSNNLNNDNQETGEMTTSNELKEIFFTLSDTSLTNQSRINVTDILSGSTVLSAMEEEVHPLLQADSHNSSLLLNAKHRVSSLFLVTLECSNQCKENNFKLQANGLEQTDIDCKQMEKKCRYNIGNGNYSCAKLKAPTTVLLANMSSEDLATSQCPVWNTILNNAVSALHREEPQSDLQARNWVDKCKDYDSYCFKESCPTGECHIPCFIIKQVLKLCQYLDGRNKVFTK